jgi:uncharacterized protein (DUF983 family)
MTAKYLPNPPRDLIQALIRGLKQRCPNCGAGRLFSRYLKVAPTCTACGEELHHHRADDAPPYFTILVVGHIVVPLVLIIETLYRPPLWVHGVLWLPLTVIAAMLALPVVKGALVSYQWALYMHGFDPQERVAGEHEGIPGI